VQLTTDGHKGLSREAVERAFGENIDYSMFVNIYGAAGHGEAE
jgi:hypothetical protein